MLLSVALALEYESKCLLAEHRLPAGLSEGLANAYVEGLIAISEPVRTFFRWRPQLRDPGDELVLEAAVNGRASAIVTFNEKDFRQARLSFGLAVIRPVEALAEISA